MRIDIEDLLGLTAEAMGSRLSPEAILLMAGDLEPYPPEEVIEAIRRCRTECKRLTMADILDRVPSYQARKMPTADEAWEKALASRMWDEDETVILPNAIFRSFPMTIWKQGDRVGARRAFIDRYNREKELPDAFETIPSYGYDPVRCASAIEDASRAGLLPRQQEQKLLTGDVAPCEQRRAQADALADLRRSLTCKVPAPPPCKPGEDEIRPSEPWV